jgi:hypothetical protein
MSTLRVARFSDIAAALVYEERLTGSRTMAPRGRCLNQAVTQEANCCPFRIPPCRRGPFAVLFPFLPRGTR